MVFIVIFSLFGTFSRADSCPQVDNCQNLKAYEQIEKALTERNFKSQHACAKYQVCRIESEASKDVMDHDLRHVAHTYLGLAALEKNKPKVAISHLKESITGPVKTMPIASSFGPRTELIHEFELKNNLEMVRFYFDKIQDFWKIESAQKAIEIFKKLISDKSTKLFYPKKHSHWFSQCRSDKWHEEHERNLKE